MPPRFAIYQAMCERLEMTGYIADAVACFHQMRSELTLEINGKQAEWTRGKRSCGQYWERLPDCPLQILNLDAVENWRSSVIG